MAWVILAGQVVLIGVVLVAVRSFGKWTKQLLHTHRSNELLLKELKLLDRRVFPVGMDRSVAPGSDGAASHVATFVQIDDEEKSA